MAKSGAHILLECIAKEGVDVIFGYPGGVTLDIYDAMPEFDIRHVLVRHEQGAVHAADGYARASGKTGVCLVTSGPGATNTVTGIATAYADSIPLVVFTGQVPVNLIGNDAFQEVDILGITRPCTKHNYMVQSVKDLPQIVRRAFYIARSGRPGPVLVELPRNVLNESMKFNYPSEPVRMRTYNPNLKPNLNQLRKAAGAIAEAKRPLFLVGGGVIMANAGEAITRLANRYQIPVTSTLMGLGAFDGTSPLHLGMLGMHGIYAANMAVSKCDLLIAVGARFDDRVTGRVASFAPKAKIIHIDIDPTSIRKSVEVSIPVVADCRLALEELENILERQKIEGSVSSAEWLEQIDAWRRECPTRSATSSAAVTFSSSGQTDIPDDLVSVSADRDKGKAAFVRPQAVIETLYKLAGGAGNKTIIATEVGQHQMWVAQFYPFSHPRTLLTSGGLGTMGYGLPAAMGAQMALPDSLVIDVAGDGSIQMNLQELGTIAANRLPVKVIILNNHYLGMVRQLQEFFYKKNYQAVGMEVQPDFVQLAEAYGLDGYRVTCPDELEPVLREALASERAVIVDIHVEPEENVYPMVPAGSGLDEMLLA
ncbi:MAG: acetolactate synthase large subunit [Desulfovibrionaceae bacterium]|nr:acetolactate synthase large subunit [Desulfovibrionaceae bacterium]